MPIKNARYVTVKKNGHTIRLAYVNGQVVEAKNLDTGATHTPADFARDRKRAAARKARKVARKKGRGK